MLHMRANEVSNRVLIIAYVLTTVWTLSENVPHTIRGSIHSLSRDSRVVSQCFVRIPIFGGLQVDRQLTPILVNKPKARKLSHWMPIMRGQPGKRSDETPKRSAGPGGAAKKRMGERAFQESALRLEDWSKFKAQLALERKSEDYPVGWAGDAKDLKRMQAKWAERAESSAAEAEQDMGVTDTNVAEWKQACPRSARWHAAPDATAMDARHDAAGDSMMPTHAHVETMPLCSAGIGTSEPRLHPPPARPPRSGGPAQRAHARARAAGPPLPP